MMEGLSGLGTSTVPIYHKPRSLSEQKSKALDKSTKKRSKSKNRPPSVPKPSSFLESNASQRHSIDYSRQDVFGPGHQRVLRRDDTVRSDDEQVEADGGLISATASIISLPPAPPLPPKPQANRREGSTLDRAWSEARRGRHRKSPESPKRVRKNKEKIGRNKTAIKSQNASTCQKSVDEAQPGKTISAAAAGVSDLHNFTHPSRPQTSPAAGTASRPDPPAAPHDASNTHSVKHLHHAATSRSPPPPRPPLISSSSSERATARPQRPHIIPPNTYQSHRPQQHPPPPFAMAPSSSTTGAYTTTTNGGPTALNPVSTFQHIQDMAAKRVSTLDYLRKTHEGRVYWFNTLLYSRPDILRLPSFQPARLARRASSLLLLGLSLPIALDAVASSSSSPLDYLRALNAVLSEFEAYQTVHPPDGSTNSSGSFSRAKIPQMFKRNHSGVGGLGKNRRASTAADIGLPLATSNQAGADMGDGASGLDSMTSSTGTLGGAQTPGSTGSTLVSGGGVGSAGPGNAPPLPLLPVQQGTNTTSLPPPDLSFLLPGEEYTYLLTPSLPFDPDFFEVFATLCDVLIDVYVRIAALVNSPDKVAMQPGLAEVFAKADARVRKVLVQGVVKEFEDATRAGVKGEVAGVGKVALGGLM